jgi:hypothetical protein
MAAEVPNLRPDVLVTVGEQAVQRIVRHRTNLDRRRPTAFMFTSRVNNARTGSHVSFTILSCAVDVASFLCLHLAVRRNFFSFSVNVLVGGRLLTDRVAVVRL